MQNLDYEINEIFCTIQGEAKFTGTPSIFIRFQGCPVGCPWCDTKHTWEYDGDIISQQQVEQKKKDSKDYGKYTVQDLTDFVKLQPPNHIVLTGGEPCINDLYPLTSKLIHHRYSVQIETSGTVPILAHNRTWITLSPKIDMAGGFKVRQEAVNKANEIKFPIGKLKDITKLVNFLKEYKVKKSVKIWLQPLSQSKRATELCIEQAFTNNWNISVQTHKYINIR